MPLNPVHVHQIQVAVAAGAAVATDIPIAGIEPGDRLLAVLQMQPPTAASGDAIVADRIDETSITSAGNIQLTTTDTTGNQLLVLYLGD